MRLIIFNPHGLPELPRDKEDPNRKIVITGGFRHTHLERTPTYGEMFELENDTEVGKVALYLTPIELEQLKGELT